MSRDLSTRRGARVALAASVLAAAVLTAPAAAQRKAPAATTPALAPAPRPPRTDVPLPPPPEAARMEPGRDASVAVAVGPWVAFDTGKSVALHVDYGFARTPSAWRRLALEYRLAATLARPAEETPLRRTIDPAIGLPVEVDAGTEQVRAWLVEIVPMARVRLPVGPSFAVFADGGVGLVQTVERYERFEMFRGHVEETQNVTGLVLRLGAGLSLDVATRVRVILEPLALSFHLGPKFSSFAPSVGVAYRQ